MFSALGRTTLQWIVRRFAQHVDETWPDANYPYRDSPSYDAFAPQIEAAIYQIIPFADRMSRIVFETADGPVTYLESGGDFTSRSREATIALRDAMATYSHAAGCNRPCRAESFLADLQHCRLQRQMHEVRWFLFFDRVFRALARWGGHFVPEIEN